MLEKVILFSGASAVGKTSVLSALIPKLKLMKMAPAVCKIDCINTTDHIIYEKLDIPNIVGISNDICPDHFLVSNLPELYNWAEKKESKTLLLETAGLCHRCSPATKRMLSGCVINATSSLKLPEQLGPMLTKSDFVVITKIDMVSQAELEIIIWQIHTINEKAEIFPVDGLCGYGSDLLADYLYFSSKEKTFEDDELRHTMPMGVCSYCVGEKRVGINYQQGVVAKINF